MKGLRPKMKFGRKPKLHITTKREVYQPGKFSMVPPQAPFASSTFFFLQILYNVPTEYQ